MAAHVKSLDRNHLLEAGLEGFYGQSSPQSKTLNPPGQFGTDFIANNRIPGIDFVTVHSYPDEWYVMPQNLKVLDQSVESLGLTFVLFYFLVQGFQTQASNPKWIS